MREINYFILYYSVILHGLVTKETAKYPTVFNEIIYVPYIPYILVNT